MIRMIRKAFTTAVLSTLLVGCGCAEQDALTLAGSQVDSARLISPAGVGEYRVGVSTLEEILGSDSAERRRVLADSGFQFEFEQGESLTAVTVSNSDYSLDNGLAVGSSAAEVRAQLGEPNRTTLELRPKSIQLDALVYDQYIFLLDQSDQVTAIRVGR